MQLTRAAVAHKLAAYVHHEISLDDLVAWANTAMMEDSFEEAYYDAIRDTVARLGLADVEVSQEDDGRWLAEISALPGVLVYGETRTEAIARVQTLALRVHADRLEHGEAVPALGEVFAVVA